MGNAGVGATCVRQANPENWSRDPFALTVEGDKLFGRGTTDCLGHVGMLTRLFIALAEAKPVLKVRPAGGGRVRWA